MGNIVGSVGSSVGTPTTSGSPVKTGEGKGKGASAGGSKTAPGLNK